ncbi:Thioredoxin-related protein [Legionella feeleii]|uniref:Thioredoxin-related protein n=2 Tax=Legionella feeleii TaxID=453 RepID=A0A2X1RA71_9GAMM|nr:Thioredoxin-related protein [Legionella feeleii]
MDSAFTSSCYPGMLTLTLIRDFSMVKEQKANHLIHEKSPYLQQHAHNPVDWYPWGKAAFDKAREENKPILLSIGYAACHWCHVMAHESFEDEETALEMNKSFINIKVDKEERPDLDKIYQTAHYFLSQQHGGWPLTIFLASDLTPFFSGTYFPREDHYQLPAFKKILHFVTAIYNNQQQDIQEQAKQLKKILQQQYHSPTNSVLTNRPLELALYNLTASYDANHGGFGVAPKFPQAPKLDYLLDHHSPLASATLAHIAKGGIYDQLAGGFYRYSVDEKWNIPHFEKMLYDNGQLLTLYSIAGQHYAEAFFHDIAAETAEWVIEEMQSSEGGYYSSLDADSEGEEGKFYRWDKTEIQAELTEKEYAVLSHYFGLKQTPNFEQYWHFYVAQPLEKVSKQLSLSMADTKKLLSTAKKKLLAKRNQRPKPFRDEKILTSWNSLMIKGMLLAGYYLAEQHYLNSAERAIHFIKEKLYSKQQLLASYKDGDAYLQAYLDDYAFLIDALLTSLTISWRTEHLLFAIELADSVLEHFSDPVAGGFFFTADNHEKLLYRPKTMTDEAIPAGNGILVSALLTLGHLLGEPRYLTAAEKTLQAAWAALMQFPAEHCSLLQGLSNYLTPPQMVIIRGKQDEIKSWWEYARPRKPYTFAIPNDALNLPQALATKKPQEKTCAYICQGLQCNEVITELEKFKTLLQ